MTLFTLTFIKQALEERAARFSGDFPKEVTGFCTDSRSVSEGNLFVALKGDNWDGHQFVAEAFAKGALAALVNREAYLPVDILRKPLIYVDHTLSAFQDLAKSYLQTLPARRVALTGSSGKTGTKELIRSALEACFGKGAIVVTEGNLNNHIGVPLTAFRVKPEHKVAVFEMGMNHFGEIASLARIVCPQVGLITNMGTAHAGNVGGPEGVAKAKAELYEALSVSDIAIVNADDPRCVRESKAKARGRKLTFGKAPWADVRIQDVELVHKGVEATYSYKESSKRIVLPLLGAHNALNGAGAVAVALALGGDFEKAVNGIRAIEPVQGRLKSYELKNGAILLDDAYNANPESVEAGLNVLASFKERRKLAVLGDMLELGPNAIGLHRMIGAACFQKGVGLLMTCGELGKAYGEGAIQSGLNYENVMWRKNSEELAADVLKNISPNDVLLVKGSHSIQMEKVVQRLIVELG